VVQAEAGVLLWHHALQGADKCEQLAGAGLLQVCLALLDPPSALPAAAKLCAAGARVRGRRRLPAMQPRGRGAGAEPLQCACEPGHVPAGVMRRATRGPRRLLHAAALLAASRWVPALR
jgi:hypothetical protein